MRELKGTTMRTRSVIVAAAPWPMALAAPAAPSVRRRTTLLPGPVEYALGDPSFYEVPNPLPAGEHGDLVRWQPIEASFSQTYRVMYLSQTVAGAPTVVTGLVAVPDDPPPFGGYPLLLYGHGTTGMADVCAPSVVIEDQVSSVQYGAEFESLAPRHHRRMDRRGDRLRGARRTRVASDARRRQ